MPKFRLMVVDRPDAGVCLDQLCQITDISHESERELLRAPDAPPALSLQLFVEIVELERCLFEIAEIHIVPPNA